MTGSNVVLYSDEVVLRPWQIEDARWYVRSRDEEVFRWTTENRALTIQETEEVIQQIKGREDVFPFAIVDPKTKELVGNIALVLESHNPGSGEVMYWLAGWGRGRGLATNAVKVLCRWAFDALGLGQVRLKTHVGNLRSQQVAYRAGFRRTADTDEYAGQAESVWFVRTNLGNPK